MVRFTFPSAVHLFLVRRGKVLLLRRFNTGYEDGKYSVVAGHLEGDEEVRAAAIREAREEAGIEIAPGDLRLVGVMHRKSDQERIDFFAVATRWTGTIVNREPHRCDRLAWFDMDALPENTIPYVRRALENYRRGVPFDSFGWPEPEAAVAAPAFQVGPLEESDRQWAVRFIAEQWGEPIVVHGAVYHPRDLPGFVAVQDGERVGLILYCVEGEDCEIVSLDSLRPGGGIGTALIEAVKEAARQARCRRLRLTTTNDNTHALRFYQRRGFVLVALRPGAMAESRWVKPSIPLVGLDDIPLRDEIDLEIVL